jgi:glycosyltransferase involved in cell wall biosynthesis
VSMAGPRAAVLLLVRDPAGAERALPRILPGRSLRLIRREEVRHLTPLRLVARLRSLKVDELVMLTDDLDMHESLWKLQALGAMPTAPRRYLLDLSGRRMLLSATRFVARDLPAWGAGALLAGLALARTAVRVRRLLEAPRRAPRPASGKRIVYLRSDLGAGVVAGGSVAHTAGVVAGLQAAGAMVAFICSDRPRLLDPQRLPVDLAPPGRLCNFNRETQGLAHSFRFERRARAVLARRPADLLYQRFDAFNHAGITLSRETRAPLVLEFNGSEVWIEDHWGRPFRFRPLFAGLEKIHLRHADLIVVVSAPLEEYLLDRGVERERILLLKNGVDPGRYRPDLPIGPVRHRLGLDGRTVVGFIGTFGRWHGAKVLARAALRVARERPNVRFLFVGDGVERPEAEAILAEGAMREAAVFTGLVPQEEGPVHLAAMDVLVAPHVPNPDGTRFFGSPTKLFEYMATGRGIVASRLEQIGEVLEHERTALLVPPGDESALAAAILRLVDDPDLRARLGASARRLVLERHTWEANVRTLLDRLRDGGLIRWS